MEFNLRYYVCKAHFCFPAFSCEYYFPSLVLDICVSPLPIDPSQTFFFFLRKRALPVGNEGSTSHWLWFFFSKSFLNNLFYPSSVLQTNLLSFLLVCSGHGFVSPWKIPHKLFLASGSGSWQFTTSGGFLRRLCLRCPSNVTNSRICNLYSTFSFLRE